jgi:hypothetical protein
MARNGAGVFAVLNPILIGALRSSSAVNQDFSDMGDEITNTLPVDGQAGMTGQFRAADGSLTMPGMSFAVDTRLGFRRTAQGEMRWVSGGQDRFFIDLDGKAWHLADMSVAGALTLNAEVSAPMSDPVTIGKFAANGAAKRTSSTSTPAWSPEPFYYTLHYTIGGYGTVIPTGVIGDLQAPAAGTIVSAALMADQTGSVSVDIWKDSYANYPPTVADSIVASSPLVVSSGVGVLDQTLSGWTTAVAAGDCFRFNVNSVTTVTRLTIALRIRRFA